MELVEAIQKYALKNDATLQEIIRIVREMAIHFDERISALEDKAGILYKEDESSV